MVRCRSECAVPAMGTGCRPSPVRSGSLCGRGRGTERTMDAPSSGRAGRCGAKRGRGNGKIKLFFRVFVSPGRLPHAVSGSDGAGSENGNAAVWPGVRRLGRCVGIVRRLRDERSSLCLPSVCIPGFAGGRGAGGGARTARGGTSCAFRPRRRLLCGAISRRC